MSEQIPGVPEGWELVRVGVPGSDDWLVGHEGNPVAHAMLKRPLKLRQYAIIRQIEKPATYRPFANGAEYMASKAQWIAVDWNSNNDSPCFFAVVSVNRGFLWVAMGGVIEQFGWEQAFEKLQFRHTDNSTSPFGVQIDE